MRQPAEALNGARMPARETRETRDELRWLRSAIERLENLENLENRRRREQHIRDVIPTECGKQKQDNDDEGDVAEDALQEAKPLLREAKLLGMISG